MDFGWLNNLGIILEIAGFVMILIAIRSARQEKGFDFGLGNVMSLKHPWINYVGIGLVIGGLAGQLASNAIPYWMTLRG